MDITISKHIPYITKKDKRNQDRFILPCMTWTWSIGSKGKILTYGYCHTQEEAYHVAKDELRNRSKFTCNS
jgi:hypothetical protein